MAGIGTFKLIKLYQYTVAKDVTGNNTETEALRFRTFAEVKDGGGSLGSDHGHNTLCRQVLPQSKLFGASLNTAAALHG